jgi:hypothetical protein
MFVATSMFSFSKPIRLLRSPAIPAGEDLSVNAPVKASARPPSPLIHQQQQTLPPG